MSQSPLHPRAEPGDSCMKWRTGMMCFGVVSVFSLLSWRCIHLQIHEHEHYRAQIDETHHKTQALSAWRGDIVDTTGRVLACDEPVQRIVFDLGFLRLASPLAKALSAAEGMKPSDIKFAFTLDDLQEKYLKHLSKLASPVVGLSEEEFTEKIRQRQVKSPTGEVVLGNDISVSAALKLRGDLEEAKMGAFKENRGTLGALIFQNQYARRYPSELSLTHIVGFFGETKPPPGEPPKPPRGVAGVERFFEEQLTGTPGARELEVDGWGNEIPAYRGSITPPRNGHGVQISLDTGLQAVVEKALDETGGGDNEIYVNDLHAERIVVVLFDPETMGVRAIGYRDATHTADHAILSNPATEMLYEPGSTIKIVTVAGAISSGKVNARSQVSISASGVYDDDDITPIHDEHAAASLTVEEVLIYSSNIGAYKLARMQGTRGFEQLIRDFGFCQTTGFESPMESRGSFAGSMNFQTLSRVAFGNAITVTPAQMCGALGAIINDGMYRPMHLAETFLDEKGKAVEGLPRVEARRVITASAAKAVRSAMVQVVERGTAKPGRSELFEIAGKTGTARKAVTIMKDKKLRTVYQGDVICSFIGFLPADKPRLGGLVIIDTPRSTKHSHFGGQMAAPLFRRIAERAMAYYEVPAQFSPDVKLRPQAASATPVKASPRTFTR